MFSQDNAPKVMTKSRKEFRHIFRAFFHYYPVSGTACCSLPNSTCFALSADSWNPCNLLIPLPHNTFTFSCQSILMGSLASSNLNLVSQSPQPPPHICPVITPWAMEYSLEASISAHWLLPPNSHQGVRNINTTPSCSFVLLPLRYKMQPSVL